MREKEEFVESEKCNWVGGKRVDFELWVVFGLSDCVLGRWRNVDFVGDCGGFRPERDEGGGEAVELHSDMQYALPVHQGESQLWRSES